MAWFSYDRYFEAILARLTRIETKLNVLIQQEKDMAVDLTTLTAEVAKNKDVSDSVVVLLNNLTAIIKAIPPSTDPTTQAALDQLAATLATNDQAVADAVVANTPSA